MAFSFLGLLRPGKTLREFSAGKGLKKESASLRKFAVGPQDEARTSAPGRELLDAEHVAVVLNHEDKDQHLMN